MHRQDCKIGMRVQVVKIINPEHNCYKDFYSIGDTGTITNIFHLGFCVKFDGKGSWAVSPEEISPEHVS